MCPGNLVDVLAKLGISVIEQPCLETLPVLNRRAALIRVRLRMLTLPPLSMLILMSHRDRHMSRAARIHQSRIRLSTQQVYRPFKKLYNVAIRLNGTG